MKSFRPRFLMVAGLAGAAGLLVNVNCGSSGGGGTGGTTGSGGTSSTGGKGGSGTGGKGGSGTGGTGTGGTATGGKGGGTGGTTSTGGTAGTGTGGTAGAGTGGSGGANGGSAGGANGGAGGANTDGGTQQYSVFNYTFDKDTQGWGFNTGNTTAGNLSNVDGGTKPTLTWDNSVGSPSTTPNGSLKIDATFTDYLQFAQVAVNLNPTVDATGREVSVYVMLDAEDGGATWPGNVQVSASSGTSYNGYTQIIKPIGTPGQWMKVELPLPASSNFDPTKLIQIAVEFTTYSRPDGGTFGAAQHRTFHVDTVTDGSGFPPPPALNLTFNSSLQGYSLSASSFTYPDGGTAPALTFDSTTGDPAGSAKLVVPFNSFNQQLDTQINFSPTVDLTGKTIHAKVMLDSGTFPSGYVQLHASAPDYSHYAQAGTSGSINATTLGSGQWVDLTMDLSTVTVTGFDASKVIQVGIQFGTGGGGDGATFPTTGEPLTFHIDSIVVQ